MSGCRVAGDQSTSQRPSRRTSRSTPWYGHSPRARSRSLAWKGSSARSSVTVAGPGVKLAWVTFRASTMSVCHLAKSAGGAATWVCMAAQSLRPQASR